MVVVAAEEREGNPKGERAKGSFSRSAARVLRTMKVLLSTAVEFR